MTGISTRFNVFEKGDTMYSVATTGSIGSRCFETQESATIASAIYDVLGGTKEVSHSEWELLVRATLRLINSPDKF